MNFRLHPSYRFAAPGCLGQVLPNTDGGNLPQRQLATDIDFPEVLADALQRPAPSAALGTRMESSGSDAQNRVFHVWTARPSHKLFQDSPSYREAWLPVTSRSRLGNDLPTNYPGSGVENVTSVLPSFRDSACPALFDIKYATHAFLKNYSWGKGTVVRVRDLMHAATNMQSVREDQTRLDLVHNRQGARLDLSVKHVPFLS